MDFDKIMEDFQEFTKSETETLTYSTIKDDYKNFLDAKEEDVYNIAISNYLCNYTQSTISK